MLTGLPDLPHLPERLTAHVRDALDETTGGLSALPGITAIVLGGSWTTGLAGPHSDLDVYVYASEPPPAADRQQLAHDLAAPGTPIEVDNRYWETGDEWTHRSGVAIDVMYRSPGWLAGELGRVLVDHRPSLGYTTCIWHNVLHSAALVDEHGWYAEMVARASAPYPEPLRQAIVDHNLPLLTSAIPALSRQLIEAADRDDRVAMLDRAAALLASYFDVLFALNRVPHPGEKRQLDWAARTCRWVPPDLSGDVERFAAALDGDRGHVPSATDALVRPLVELVERHR